MQVYGLVGQTEEGIWPEAQAGTTYDKENLLQQIQCF